jgi:hypothetical protein
LLGVSLETIAPSAQDIRRLLGAAERQIADSRIRAVSAETRFGAAYTTEYTGDSIPESAVAECLSQAEPLRVAAVAWLTANKPELL